MADRCPIRRMEGRQLRVFHTGAQAGTLLVRTAGPEGPAPDLKVLTHAQSPAGYCAVHVLQHEENLDPCQFRRHPISQSIAVLTC